MTNPLVVWLPIAPQGESIAQRDFQSIFDSFHVKMGYDIAYSKHHNIPAPETQSKEQKKEKQDSSTKQVNIVVIKGGKTLEWKLDGFELDSFNTRVKNELINKHNYDGLIYFLSRTRDETGTVLLQDIHREFNNENCKSLINKPKIFIVDHSRGEKKEKKLHPRIPNENSKSKSRKTNKLSFMSQGILNTNEYDDENEAKVSILKSVISNTYYETSHMHTIFSSKKGYTSYADKQNGSLLIQSICKSINEMNINVLNGHNSTNNGIAIDSCSLNALVLRAQEIAKVEMKRIGVQHYPVFQTATTMLNSVVFGAATKIKPLKKQKARKDEMSTPRQIPIAMCHKPLVVVINIDSKDPDLSKKQSLLSNYFDTIYALNYKRHYSIMYQRADKYRPIHLSKPIKSAKEINAMNGNFKIHWSHREILKFNERVQNELLLGKYNYDGLFYIISCAGKLLDSLGGDINTETIFETFNSEKVPNLATCPKIFILDCDTGGFPQPRKQVIPHSTSNNTNLKLTPATAPSKSASVFTPWYQPITEIIETEAAKHIPTEYSNNDDVMFIYSASGRYSKANQKDKTKSTFFIRAFSKAFIDERIFGKHDFNTILYCTNSIMQQLMYVHGVDSVGGQVIKVESTMRRNLYLVKHCGCLGGVCLA